MIVLLLLLSYEYCVPEKVDVTVRVDVLFFQSNKYDCSLRDVWPVSKTAAERSKI